MNFKENESAQKLRGGYYTPGDLADFIAKWTCRNGTREVLEPSCGDGQFLDALAKAGFTTQGAITAFELDSAEAKKAKERAAQVGVTAQIYDDDFLLWALGQLDEGGKRFDAIVGNPPFIRYQYLPENFQVRAEQIFRRLECKFTKHTNAWVPFILASVALLRPGGRLGMVVPAEVIHVTHAQSLRSFLGDECKRIVIIDPEELWFDGTLQGAVILLAEKKRSASEKGEGLGIVSVRNREFVLGDAEELFRRPKAINGKTVSGKWTRALLGADVLQMLDALEDDDQVHRFADVADVDVGIVTGANKFFLVSSDVVTRYGLGEYAHPMFGRSEHCPGILYDERQHQENAASGKPTNFLWFKGPDLTRDKRVRKYIELGEAEKLHTRFKCRIRTPWYTVPSVYATEIGMLKRSHNSPRLILNKAGAFTTDTAYRIRSRKVAAEKLVCCFVNPLTSLSAELEGRHYGGGVLELVPSEIEKLTVPLPDDFEPDIEKLDAEIRTRSTLDVLASHGSKVLEAMDIDKSDRQRIVDAWWALRNRRHRVSTEPVAAERD
jgi:adenine-specific DNA-methyltransferase